MRRKNTIYTTHNYRLCIRRRLAAALVIALFFCGACSSPEPEQAPATAVPTATPWPDTYSGGEALENINAKEILCSSAPDGGAYEISIKFVHGSRIAGVDEASASEVPAYRAYKLGSPSRIVVEFDSLNYWDYERMLQIDPDDPMLYGAFKVTEASGGRFGMYFQLKNDFTFNVTEEAGALKLALLHAASQSAADGYHIIANALSAYREGSLADSGLTPALCEDLTSVALISERFASEDEAIERHNAIMDSLAGGALEGRTDIVRLSGEALPAYNTSLDFTEVTGLAPVRIVGSETQLPVLMPDGLYLCSSADGRRHLLSRPLSEEPGEESLVDIQELWIVDESGRAKRLTDFEFAAIEQAAFSPDGRRLAILERTEDASFLYIYDMDTNELSFNLGEEGFGSMTSNFVWDSMGTAIYAVSGTEQLQLLKYDFTIPDETKRVSRVDETPMGDGDLGFFDGDLYFSDVSTEGDSIIYKIKPEGGIRAEYAKGSGFRISPDNKYMVILDATAAGGEETETTETATLTLKTIATGEEQIIVQNKFVVDFSWGYGGSLYYSIGENIGATDDEYPYTLIRLTPGVVDVEIADMIAPDFFPAPSSDTLFLPVQTSVGGNNIRATYILDLG